MVAVELPEFVSVIVHISFAPDPEQLSALARTCAELVEEALVEVVVDCIPVPDPIPTESTPTSPAPTMSIPTMVR